jgi:peptide/nickel transport system substrate-binding protein
VSDYWNRWWTVRANRRRVLAGGGIATAGVAGLALVGCGDDDDDDDEGTATATSATGTTAAATGTGTSTATATAQAAQPNIGGTLRIPMVGISSGDPPTLFPYENLTYLAQVPSAWHYSRLLRSVSGPDIAPTDHTALEGDVVSEWEQPDDATYVFTLKDNVKFHNKAPMNGRLMTATDILNTWETFKTVSQNANGWNAIVSKFEAPDEKTIKVTLNAPFAPFLTTHASSAEALWLIPVETISNDQVKTDPVGTGPYVFDNYETGVAINWDRHAEFHDSPLPHYERVEASLLRDPQRIIQALQAGDLDASGLSGTVYQDAHSKLDPKGQELFIATGVQGGFYFNFDNEPWRDKRVRQALSMLIDRDGLLKALDGTGKGDWQSHLSPAMAPFFMSPRDRKSDFGPNVKYFERNVAEAKKLLSAATGSDTISFKVIANVDRYGAAAQALWELLQSTLASDGVEIELEYMEYGAYIQSIFIGQIPSGAVGLGPLIGSPRDPDDLFFRLYHSTAPRHNWGGTPIDEQASLDAMFDKSRTIIDVEERIANIEDIQRAMAESMLIVPYPGNAGYGYVQPWIENYNDKGGYAYIIESFAKSWFTKERIAKG